PSTAPQTNPATPYIHMKSALNKGVIEKMGKQTHRIFLIAMVFSQMQLVYAADLLQIYQDAKTQDPIFSSAQAAYQAGQERLPQGRAGLLPSVNISANATHSYTKSDGTPAAYYDSSGYTLTLSQPLYRSQNLATYQQAKQQVLQAEAQFSAAHQDLILRVAQIYFDVLLAQDNVTVSQAQKNAFAEQLAQAKQNFKVGTATITDTNEAQARYDQAIAKEIVDLNDLEIKRQALQQLIAKIPEQLTPLKDPLTLVSPTPNNINEWVAASEQNNQTLTVLKAGVEIAKSEVQKQRAGYLPSVDLVASYNSSRNAFADVFGSRVDLKTSQIGVQVTLPLYAGGGTQSRVREALANQDKSNFDLEANRRSVAQSTRTAFLGVTSGITQVQALEQALKSSQVSLDSTKLGREVGVRTSLDVLNAEQQVFQARRDLLQARYNVILNQLKLKSAAGQLNDGDLVEVNKLLQEPQAVAMDASPALKLSHFLSSKSLVAIYRRESSSNSRTAAIKPPRDNNDQKISGELVSLN
ncbi:MAG: TolC family outer membrane protein, partial [Pseudomonadota bacterium]